MKKSWNEQERLKALEAYEVLDTPNESDFDDIVKIASHICETPISLVSLVAGDRQWFKAKVGVDLDETPLGSSICSHAILQGEMLVVPDASKDPRFDCNPFVSGDPHIRFYAGALLETRDGLPLGTLCVIDYKERELTEKQQEMLQALARQVMAQLELRRSLREQQKAERELASQNLALGETVRNRTSELAEIKTIAQELEERSRLAAIRSDINEALIGREETQVVLQKCTEALVKNLGVAFARIWILHEADQVLELKASAGLYTHLDGPHERVKVGEFKIGRIAASGKALLTNSVSTDPNISSPEWAKREGMVAFAGYPMKLDGRTIGVMGMFSRQTFSETAFAELEPITSNISQWLQRRQIENDLKESEEKFRALADNISQFTWMADASGMIFWYNQRWFNYTGTTLKEMEGWGWSKVHHPDYIEPVTRKWTDHLARGEKWEDTFPLRGRDGNYRWFLSRAFPIRNTDGTIARWFGTNTDITELRDVQIALREAQISLAEQNQLLDQTVQNRTARLRETIVELEAFSFSMSHDMRSPLRAMQGYSDALLQDHAKDLNAEAKQYLERIHRGATRLDLLIRDVLAYSKVAKGEVEMKPLNVELLIEDILQNYPDLHPANIEVSVSKIPLVLAHEGLLTQIVSNLLGNALKFAVPGVFPRVEVFSETGGEMVQIWFKDNGIGIDEKHFQQIFQIFGRIHPEKSFEGTGIGLAIVRKAAERMRGSSGVDGALGEGSRFWVKLWKAE